MELNTQTIAINQWKEEVESYLEVLNQEISNVEISKQLSYGFYAFDSKLIFDPEIMFIGINPGKGDGTKKERIKILPDQGDRLSYLDYFDEEYNYPLAKETVNLLKLVGFSEDEIIEKFENKCVKTNLFYLATKSEKDIKSCFSSIDKYKEFYKHSTYFTIELIKILQPKIVIFEGKSAYENIIETCYEINNTWTDGIGYVKSNLNNPAYIGYSRAFSRITSDKEKLAELIRQELNLIPELI